jgi:hypothetical protein
MGMGTINFVVFYIVFMDHATYICVENKVEKDVVIGGRHDPAPMTAPVPFGMNYCSSHLLNLLHSKRLSLKSFLLTFQQSIFFSPRITVAHPTTTFTHLLHSFCNDKTYISS